MKYKHILIIFAVLASVNAEYKQFRNHKVYKIVPQLENDVAVLSKLQEEGRFYFWKDIIQVNGDVRIMVAPEEQKEFENYLKSVGIYSNVVIQDVQRLIDDQLRRPKNIGRSATDYAWDYYQNLDEINAWLDAIVAEFPDVVTPVTMGRSNEGREIRGIIIDYQKLEVFERPTIGMIEGGIHAREWISPATVTWIINEFLRSTDPQVRALAENVVWHIFPVVNPDGYVYTFTDNRMWRKNRNTANFTSCPSNSDLSNGIDLNRNFGFLWMTVGASQNPCSETFAGPVAFSEPESVAISNYVTALFSQGNFVFYYAFHSYSQMVLVPYSHLGGANVLGAPNYADMYEIAIKGMDRLRERYGTYYRVGTSLDILYPTSGGSFDWVKSAGVPIVFLFELRDIGQFGFLLPSELIIPNNEEIIDGLLEMDRVTRELGYYQHRSSSSRIGLSAILLSLGVMFSLY